MFDWTGVSPRMLHLPSQLLQSRVELCIQGPWCNLWFWVRRAGIQQGNPFSPAIFALLAFAMILVLQELHVGLRVRMYADDFSVYLLCSAEEATPVAPPILHCLREFGLYTGLRMNVGKSTIIRKGPDKQANM